MPESSEKTRVLIVDPDKPAPTVMAYGMGNCKYSQVYLVDLTRRIEEPKCHESETTSAEPDGS